jgi:hypothetical protein
VELSSIGAEPSQIKYERWIWISLLTVSLISVGGLLVKLRERKK